MASWVFSDKTNCCPENATSPKRRRAPRKKCVSSSSCGVCTNCETEHIKDSCPSSKSGSGDCPKIDPCKTSSALPVQICRVDSFRRKIEATLKCYCTLYHLLLASSALLIAAFLLMYTGCLCKPFMSLADTVATYLPDCWKSVDQRIHEALARYAADDIGIADHALESAGGSVLCSSETFHYKGGLIYSIF